VTKLNAIVVGYGYWGPNLARNINQDNRFKLRFICDLDIQKRKVAASHFSNVEVIDNYEDAIKKDQIDAVFIATPPSSHFRIALHALKHGKHVLVEKPLACSSSECMKLRDEAHKNSCVLMVDHTFAYTGAVRKMQELSSSSIGELLYYDSVRINLGLFQRDVNVMWDLAVHDLAILNAVTNFSPIAISATGHSHVDGYPSNTAYLTLFYNESFIAHIHCSWMAPVKIRKTLLGGSKKMVVYDDLEPTEKIKVYDKGISINPSNEEKHALRVDYRTADVFIPKLENAEALSLMLEEFYRAIKTGSTPLTSAHSGHRIVSMLEAADLSLAQKGKPVELSILD
jgi:predicted dehydrogenase